MYARKQLFIICLLVLWGKALDTGGTLYAQCPTIKAIMVDPCGDDIRNEFIILDSGTGFNTRDLQINFDVSGNGSGLQNNDINVNVDNEPGTRACRFQPGNPKLINGCENIRVVSQDEEIPPDAIVIVQTSGNADEVYDFSTLCGNGECVYVLQNDCVRTLQAFSNKGSGLRTTGISLANTQCDLDFTYDRSSLTNGDGDFYAPQGSSLYGNRCSTTPPVGGATIPPEFVNPGELYGCGSFTLPAISGLYLTGGERYYTGPGGTGVSYSVGSVLTRPTTLFIFDITAPCSPEEIFRINILDPITPELIAPTPICEEDAPITLNTVQDGITGSWSGIGVVNNVFVPDLNRQGTYTLTFTPAPGECANPNSIDIAVLPSPVAATRVTAATCNGNNAGIGIFDLTILAPEVNGGTNERVLWFEDAALNTLIEDSTDYATASTTVYAIVDNGACLSAPSIVELAVGDPIDVKFTNVKSLNCYGDTDGEIDIAISGGTPPYDIRWSDSAYDGESSLRDLIAGVYTVTVTGDQGCEFITSVTLVEPDEIILECNKIQDVGTVVGEDGTASFSVTGGIPPYWVRWDGPVIDSAQVSTAGEPLTVNTLRAGVYEVSVRDALGCVGFCQVEIEAPNCELEVSYTSTDPSCWDAADGSIEITATGATGDLTYTWRTNSLNGLSTLTSLASGIYEVTVSDEIGCAEILTIELSSPPPLFLSCNVQSPVSSLGGEDGKAQIQIGGGTPPYQANWTGPKSGNISIGMDTEFIIDNLSAGSYNIVLLDANSCEQVCSFTIPDGECATELNVVLTNESCPGTGDGTLNLELLGDWVSPYTIDWDRDQFDGLTQLNNLGQGTYSVTVTGANSCQVILAADIDTDFTIPTVSFPTAVSVCSGSCYTYEFRFTGTPPFRADFVVDNGSESFPLTITTNQLTENLTLCPSDYGAGDGNLRLQLLRLSDDHCLNEEPAESVLTILQAVTSTYSPTLCPGEEVSINGQTYNFTRPSGTEILTGAAASGCDSIVNIDLSFNTETIKEIRQTLCPQESLTIHGQIYDINRPSGTETVPSVTGCDSLIIIDLSFYPPAIEQLEISLCPGEDITINGHLYNEQNRTGTEIFPGSSSNGCDSTLEVFLIYYEAAIGLISETICPNEEVTVNGQVYNLEKPSGTEIIPGGSVHGCDSIIQVDLAFFDVPMSVIRDTLCSTESLTINGSIYDRDRPSGMERFSGAGENGCDSMVQVELIFQEDIMVSIKGGQDICRGESATLEFEILNAITPIDIRYMAEGESPIWLYGVEDGDQIQVTPVNTTTYTIIEVQAPPEYCSVNIGGTATVQVSFLMLDAVVDSDYDGYGVSCSAQQDGAIRARISSGEGPFDFLWQDGVRTQDRTNLGPGVYSVLVTDAYGCTAEALAQLEPPPTIDLQLSTLPLDCRGEQSGTLIIDSIWGGNPGYSLRLDEGLPQNVPQLPLAIGGLSAGRHTLEIADEFGCATVQEFEIAPFTPLSLDLGPDKKIRYGASIRLDAITNFEIDSLFWTPSDSLTPPNGLPTMARPAETTTYTVTAFDSRGCPASDQITVFVTRDADIYVPNAFSPNGDGINDLFYPFTNHNIKEIVEFKIFDRWGNLMHQQREFQGNEERFGWNGKAEGKPMDPAVFIFFIRYRYLDDRDEMIKGNFTLMR